ncbi:MAG: DASS family sodium-coupled anion symporter, partial [Plesiomonas shigelloides]
MSELSVSPSPASGGISRSSVILAADILLLGLLLAFLPFEPAANKGLALMIFIGVLWLTEALHVTLTALLVPIMAVVLGLLEAPKALSMFADPIIFLFFGGFALATALHIQGIDRLLANQLLLAARGRMGVAVMMLFGVSAGLSMWISNTATAAMMLPLALGVLAQLDSEKDHRTFVFVLLGIAYSCSIGGLGTLVGSPPNAIAAAQLGLDFAGWMKFGIPVMLVTMPLMIGLLYLLLRPNLRHTFKVEVETLSWTRPRLLALAIFALTVVCWIFSTQISAALGGVKQFDSLVALSAAVLIGACGVANWQQIQKNTEW